jgi:hypothetical protein
VQVIGLDDHFGRGVFGHPAECPSLVSLLRGHRVGELCLDSGAAVVSDPYLLDKARPLHRALPVGSFPVFVGASEVYFGHDVTGLCVRFANSQVARWEAAFKRGVGVPIDSASVAICDAARAAVLKPFAIETRFHDSPVGGAVFASGQVAACGLGSDGCYPVYYGLNAGGAVVRLAVTAVKDHFVSWSYEDLPNLARLDEVAEWIAKIQGRGRRFLFGKTSAALVTALERHARRKVPPALREYYRLFRPWDGDLMPLWRKWAPPGALPLSLSKRGGHVLTADGAVREITKRGLGGQALDIPSWLVLYAITLYNLASE